MTSFTSRPVGAGAGAPTGSATWTIRQAAGPDDRAAVLDLLDVRSAWLHARGVTDQWPSPFPRAIVDNDLAAGATRLVVDDGQPIATFALHDTDPIWPDGGDGAHAVYLHTFATRGDRPGLGRDLLERIGTDAAADGRLILRLDCVADNVTLCAYYAGAGFTEHSRVQVHATPESGWPGGSSAELVLWERRLSPP